MGALLERFSGEDNKGRLLDAIRNQALIANDSDLAEKIMSVGVVEELEPGQVVIKQGEWDDDLIFILAGEMQVTINGNNKAIRKAGTHVGELTATAPQRARTATVSSVAESLILKVKNKDMKEIGGNNPEFLKRMLDVLASRLDERNEQIGKANEIPKVFIISSTEQLPIVEQIVTCLDSKEIAVHTWDKGTFGLSDYPISSLMDAIEASDFTISVVAPDDTLIMRKDVHPVARDNVHLEYGISLGLLGRLRSLLLVCADNDIKLPSDTAGLTTLRYRHGSKEEMERTVRNACLEAKKHILNEGVLTDRRAR